MKSEWHNEDLLIRYLLGELSAEEQGRIEERFFTDEEFFEQLSALENELRYDYARGKLSGRHRELFEKRFLASPEEQQGVERAGAILQTLDRAKAISLAPGQGLWQTIKAFFTARGASLSFALATVALLLVATTAWSIYQTVKLRNQLEQVQAERKMEEERLRHQTQQDQAQLAQLNTDLERERLERERLEEEIAKHQTQTTGQQNLPLLPGILSFALSPGGVRDAGEGSKKLVIAPDTRAVQFELKLQKNLGHQSFRAQLLTADGAEIWHRDNLKATGKNLVLQILAQLLAEGDYELALKGRAANRDYEEAGSYYFTIVKK
jgi:anti-sigma factor RsiW